SASAAEEIAPASLRQIALDQSALGADERTLLINQLDWFGELSVATADGNGSPKRAAMLQQASSFVMIVVVVFCVAAFLALLGFGGLVTIVVFWLMGKLRSGLS